MSDSRPALRLLATEQPAMELPLIERDDDALMLLARAGVGPAFNTLVRRHQARVLKVAAKYLGDPALARDVAQAAFLELYRARDRYRPQGQFTSYLYRVLLNQCRMACRSRHSFSRLTAAAVPLDDQPGPNAEDLVLARERQLEVERALVQLSDKLRSVIVLRFGGDLPLVTIAETLSIPLGTVKRRLFDGLTRLRALLEAS